MIWASLLAQTIRNLPAIQETKGREDSPGPRRFPWRRERLPTPVFLPENPMDRGAW